MADQNCAHATCKCKVEQIGVDVVGAVTLIAFTIRQQFIPVQHTYKNLALRSL